MSQYFFILQFGLMLIIGLFFLSKLNSKRNAKRVIEEQSKQQEKHLKILRSVNLHIPLTEMARPQRLDDIVGQKQGIMALRSAICGPNPQHVLIYGPSGVGKTCAARLVLEAAKQNHLSPFMKDAKLIEISAGCLRYDERNIADPLLGSVHDPIYQGAGAFGLAGIPQPRPGAVTKAHGSVLFIDEIGELSPQHMQKLLKVLEDRCVFFESSYYSSTDKRIPKYIHDVFANGMPADFRLIGATTKQQKQIPSAIRSRCVEIFFRPLYRTEVISIAKRAAYLSSYVLGDKAAELVGDYAFSGRDAVSLVQLSAGIARENGLNKIGEGHIQWILETGKYTKRPKVMLGAQSIGCVNGLAISGSGSGTVIEIETVAIRANESSLRITGLVDEEEILSPSRKFRRKSTARSSVENVLTALKKAYGFNPEGYYLHINLPGSVPVDGPSAGVAIAVSLYSSVYKKSVRPKTAVTGELSINGNVRGVGGVHAKVLAAKYAGANLVIVPADNLSEAKTVTDIEVKGVSHISEVINMCFYEESSVEQKPDMLVAKGT